MAIFVQTLKTERRVVLYLIIITERISSLSIVLYFDAVVTRLQFNEIL